MNDTVTSPPQQTLVRPVDGRVIAGVAQGIAHRLNVGAGWIRVAFVVLSLFGGIGVLLYILGWLAIREEGATTAIAENWIGDLEGSTAWIGLGLVVLAGVVLLGSTDVVRMELVLAAGIFLAGVLLYRGTLRPGGPTGISDTAEGASSDITQDSTGEDGGGVRDVGGDGGAALPPSTLTTVSPPPPSPPPPRPPRERSYLGRIVVASGLIVIGVLALLDNLDVIDPGFRHYLAGGVLVLGAGLLVGTFYGRARGLIALGLLVTPLLLVSAAIRVPLAGDYGERVYRPATAAELRTNYELSGGQLLLDLRLLDEATLDTEVNVDLGIGEMLVWVPAGVDVIIDGRVGIGALSIIGGENAGLGVDDAVELFGGDGDVDLRLTVEVGIGNLEVYGTR